MRSIYKCLLIPVLYFAATAGSYAGTAAAGSSLTNDYLLEITLGLALTICLVVLLVLIVMLNVLKAFVRIKNWEPAKAVETPRERISWWSSFIKKMTDSTPLEREGEVLTGHEYDGIRELDNNLPPWWKYLFYLTIVFAVGYLVHYHWLSTGPLQEEEYSQQMARAEEAIRAYQATQAKLIDETNVEEANDAETLTDGKAVYIQYCAACHAQDGGGGVGPNLTDSYWIHGGSVNEIFKTIRYGVPQKGMISWENQLSPVKIKNVANFILTLGGTTPADPKEPQGELYEPAEKENSTPDETVSMR